MLSLNNLTVGYTSALLKNINLEIEYGDIICILGKNGTGKTTLLETILGRVKPYKGEVTWSKNTSSLVSSTVQNFQKTLIPWKSAKENICFPLELRRYSKEKIERIFNKLYAELPVRLPLQKKPAELSGGQCQLVAVLRAIYSSPSVIFLDEPFSALDYYTKLRTREYLLKILKANNITALIISHDPADCIFLADKLLAINNDRIEVHNCINLSDTNKLEFFKKQQLIVKRCFN